MSDVVDIIIEIGDDRTGAVKIVLVDRFLSIECHCCRRPVDLEYGLAAINMIDVVLVAGNQCRDLPRWFDPQARYVRSPLEQERVLGRYLAPLLERIAAVSRNRVEIDVTHIIAA